MALCVYSGVNNGEETGRAGVLIYVCVPFGVAIAQGSEWGLLVTN